MTVPNDASSPWQARLAAFEAALVERDAALLGVNTTATACAIADEFCQTDEPLPESLVDEARALLSRMAEQEQRIKAELARIAGALTRVASGARTARTQGVDPGNAPRSEADGRQGFAVRA